MGVCFTDVALGVAGVAVVADRATFEEVRRLFIDSDAETVETEEVLEEERRDVLEDDAIGRSAVVNELSSRDERRQKRLNDSRSKLALLASSEMSLRRRLLPIRESFEVEERLEEARMGPSNIFVVYRPGGEMGRYLPSVSTQAIDK